MNKKPTVFCPDWDALFFTMPVTKLVDGQIVIMGKLAPTLDRSIPDRSLTPLEQVRAANRRAYG